jgi:hypothetical protein
MVKLTHRTVRTLLLAERVRELIVWDDEVGRFGLRIKPTGTATWIVQYRDPFGKSRRITLGPVARLDPVNAQRLAREILSAASRGTGSGGGVSPHKPKKSY